MATYNSWTWSEPHRRYYYLDAAGNVRWDESKQAEDRKVTPSTPSTPGWAFSASYGRYYKYERAHDGTVIETLWTDPGPPKENEAAMGGVAFSDWTWSTQYNCSYKLMYGKDNVILKTIWETGSPDQTKMLIQSLKRDVCFDDRQGNAGNGHYVTMKYRTSGSDEDRQRDDRNDRNRHGRSGYRDSDPSGGRQHPDNGDQPDHDDDTQSSPGSSYSQYSPYASTYYAAPAYLRTQHPMVWQ